MVSRYQENLNDSHWMEIKNILKYLKRTKDMLLVYGVRKELRFTEYSDASFQSDRDNSFSLSGWVFLLNRANVTWKGSK